MPDFQNHEFSEYIQERLEQKRAFIHDHIDIFRLESIKNEAYNKIVESTEYEIIVLLNRILEMDMSINNIQNEKSYALGFFDGIDFREYISK